MHTKIHTQDTTHTYTHTYTHTAAAAVHTSCTQMLLVQVILKPDPGNSQELYLGSLEALGIDTRKHDVRFVEDNWESPVLGLFAVVRACVWGASVACMRL